VHKILHPSYPCAKVGRFIAFSTELTKLHCI